MESTAHAQAFIAQVKRQSDRALLRELQKLAKRIRPTSAAMAQALQSALIRGGKRLRPALVVAGYRAAGKRADRRIIQAGVAVELLHVFALIHDDIIDGSVTRRGVATMHVDQAQLARRAGLQNPEAIGVAQSILVGDLLLSAADEALEAAGFSGTAAGRARALFLAMRTELIAGQYEDVELSLHLPKATPKQVLHVMSVKSGHYTIALPLLLGATLGSASASNLRALRTFAEPAGIAFQLQDDLLGTFGSAAVGKPTDSDIREGKATLLAVHALHHATAAQRGILLRTLGNRQAPRAAVAKVRTIFIATGAKTHIERQIERYIRRAEAVLTRSRLPGQTKKLLADFGEYLVQRST
ncbi:MAG: polyprenyl synthetase family protein [Patescibacteria group bacterium]